MKVVVLVGTKGPFPRLVNAVAAWAATRADAEVWVQDAVGALPPGWRGGAFAPHAEVLAAMADADVVICHAGSGTVRDALKLGHRPVTVPRLARHGEHVNDHQLELVEALGDRIVGCKEPERADVLALAIETARSRRSSTGELPGDALRADLRRAVGHAQPADRAELVWSALGLVTAPFRRWLRSD